MGLKNGDGTKVPAMPIRAKPYDHQQRAFEFACRIFGLMDEGNKPEDYHRKKEGGANDSNQ